MSLSVRQFVGKDASTLGHSIQWCQNKIKISRFCSNFKSWKKSWFQSATLSNLKRNTFNSRQLSSVPCINALFSAGVKALQSFYISLLVQNRKYSTSSLNSTCTKVAHSSSSLSSLAILFLTIQKKHVFTLRKHFCHCTV